MAEVFDFGLQQHKIKMDGKFFLNNFFSVAVVIVRCLEVQLLDSNNMVQNTTGISLRLNANVAGQATYAEATLVDATKGLYELDLPNGMLLAPGNWQFQWQLIGSNGEKLNSFAFMGSIGSNLSEGANEAVNFYINIEEIKALQEDFLNGTINSAILQTNIENKLIDLEEEYAPVLTGVVSQLGQTQKYPIKDYEYIDGASVVINKDYPYWDLLRYGLKDDYISDAEEKTNNYPLFLKVLAIAQDGMEFNFFGHGSYYFGGLTKITIDKQLQFVGRSSTKLIIRTDDGNGFDFTNRYSGFTNLDLHGVSKTIGTGLKIAGIAPSFYNAYCKLNNVKATNFNVGFFIGDSFHINVVDLLARDCGVGFRFNNLSTMLLSTNCYALRCGTGHLYESMNYSTIINPAADYCDIAYNFKNITASNVISLGAENSTKRVMEISNSIISINGFEAVGNKTDAGFGSLMTITTSSQLKLSGVVELTASPETLATVSLVIDATSIVTIENSRTLLDFYIAPSGQLNGNVKVNGVIKYYKRGNKEEYLPLPPTTGNYKVGDRVVNTSIGINNPVEGWTCIGAGSPGDWRPFGLITNRGTSTSMPSLSGFNHIGARFILTNVPKVATWNGTSWIYQDYGTTV